MLKYFSKIILVGFVVTFAKVYSQETKTFKINKLGQNKGLLQLNAQALSQDSLGFLWVGTEDGLHRFNGYEFKPFVAHAKDSTTLIDDHIRGLLAIGDTLWIATNSKGVSGYRFSENKFFETTKSLKKNDLQIAYKILKLDAPHLLFSTRNHFILFNRKDGNKQIFKLPENQRENFVEDVIKVSKNTYWLATRTSGILEFNIVDGQLKRLPFFNPSSASAFIKKGNSLFISSEKGLYKYLLSSNKLNIVSETPAINTLFLLDNEELLVATHQGMFCFNLKTEKTSKIIFEDKLNNTYENIVIEKIVKDDKGNLWLGTAGEGVFYLNKFQKKFETVQVKISNSEDDQRISVFPFFKRNDSILWIGSTKGTLAYNLTTKTFKRYNTGKNGITYCFAEDDTGTLWAGGIYDGLMKYNPKTDQFSQWLSTDTQNGLPDNEVLTIIPRNNSKLWLCTWAGGITEFDTVKETFTPILINGEQLNRVRVYLHDSENNLWLGTDQGLYKVSENRTATVYTQSDSEKSELTNDRVFALKEDQQGNIWIGTSSGLTKLNPKTQSTTLYFKQKGFSNDFVYTILIDKKNHIWLSTNYGLSVLNPATNTFKSYTKEDGLQDNEFNGKSGFKDIEGMFYFGGINGFNIFNPEEIIDNPHFPKIYLESVELFNKPIERNELFKDTLQFKSEENVLTFNFTALNYSNPQKVSYQYKLDNFDKQWSPPSSKRSVTYTNLNPGNYTLNIKATNDAGLWGDEVKRVALVIIPPWYQTTVFKISLFVCIILLIIGFYFYKTSRLKREKIKLEKLVYERTQDLIQKNKALEASNETTLKQRNNIEFLMKELSHRVKNNLQIVSSLLNIQANSIEHKKSKEILTIAKNRILAISYVQAQLNSKTDEVDVGKFVENFSLKMIETLTDEDSLTFELQFDIKNNTFCNVNITLIGLILNELITNTFKYAFNTYSKENILRIECSLINKTIKLSIKDNGIGYNKESIKKGSLGLDMVTEMVHQLNGTIITETQNGVKNTITIPCNKNTK